MLENRYYHPPNTVEIIITQNSEILIQVHITVNEKVRIGIHSWF